MMQPVKSGYADVNGIELWHEVYGQGDPLVLIHGGLTTIGEMQAWVEELARTRQVIAVEMQGHGHTTDTEADALRDARRRHRGEGLKEPGWQNTELSKSRLAIVPGYSHYNFLSSPEVPVIIAKFLADPLTNPSTGAAAASQAAPV